MMIKKIAFCAVMLTAWSHYASASCNANGKDCSLYDGALQTGQKKQDDVWNKKPVEKKDPQINRMEDLFVSAKQTGENALSSGIAVSKSNANSDGIAETWCVTDDMTLSDNMKAWAKRAHWHVQWNSEYDYPIDAGFCVSGSFQQAINTVASSYITAQRVLRLDIYPKQTLIVFSTK